MSTPIEVVAIITPKPDKFDRVLDLLTTLAHTVHATEPNCLKYHLHRRIADMQTGSLGHELVMIETYRDKAAWELHMGSEGFKELGERFGEEGLLGKEVEILSGRAVAGFGGRG